MSNLSRLFLFVLLIGFSGTFAPVFDPGGTGGGASLTVKEGDDDPSVSNVETIVITNGTLTDDGGGQVSISISGTGAPTDATYIVQTPNGDLSDEQALSALATGCLGSATTTGVVSARTITGTANQISVANGDCSGNPTLSIPNNPTLPGTTTGTFSGDLTGNVTGNASGTAGSLAANGANCAAGLAPLGVDASGAVESCTDYAEEPGSNGILAKTAANTITNRTITGTANEISVANGDGVAGNPTLSIPSTLNLSSKTLRIPNGTELPGSCTAGDQFMDTDATTGQRHYLCESANTWVVQGDGGGAGEGTVTSVDATGGVETASGSAITETGTIRGVHIAKAETGTTYTVLTGDRGKALTLSNADPIAVTLPQAGTGFEDGWYVWVKNIGVGDATITPTTSTIDGTTSLVLSTNQMAMIRSDGTNYQSYGKALLAEADTLQTTFARDAEVTGANSEANCLKIGDGTNHACFFWDATDGFRVTTDPIGDLTHWIPSNQNYVLHDEEDDSDVLTINPDSGGTGVASVAYRAGSVFTGVTLDVEGSNNTITTTTKVNYAAAVCSGTTGTLNLDTNATLAPTAACAAGSTNTTLIMGYAEFPDSDGEYQVQIPPFQLPADWTGAIDVKAYWRAAATSGDVIWQTQTMCTDDAEVEDVAWNTADAFAADTAKGTTLQLNEASDTGITTTGCTAGDIFHLKFFRQRTHASDTIAGVVQLKNFELTVRRAQ
jgi:hypothetical protein